MNKSDIIKELSVEKSDGIRYGTGCMTILE